MWKNTETSHAGIGLG